MRNTHSIVFAALLLASAPAWCADSPPSPVGLRKTIDDKTGQPRGIVRVYEQEGHYSGRIERGLIAGEVGRKCTACTDARKDHPFTGLVLMRNVKLDNGEYGGGDILDPDTGSVYRCSFKLEEGGQTLVVRGYVGVSVFGWTQKWLREPG